ncbi:hypothetical protein HK103_000599 [Boothiomyces macroporosus]|uniref:THUMP domain-containing protein n=1 Tax=Boothiomyces macroporosus TaxID=261099 RepID=A0AAD5UL27_9FUNG|nr:hypothetical protein HK103_000599 [Boothiomyces macroporosus]
MGKQKAYKPQRSDTSRSFTLPTGTKGFLTNDTIEPVSFALKILNELIESKIKNTRYTSRIIPISDTCFALMKDIKEMASKRIHEFFDGLEPSTFVIVPKIRNNTSLKNARDELIQMVAEIVPTKHKVDINGAKYSIMLEIMNNVCGISIVTDYNRLKKFNLEQFENKENPE